MVERRPRIAHTYFGKPKFLAKTIIQALYKFSIKALSMFAKPLPLLACLLAVLMTGCSNDTFHLSHTEAAAGPEAPDSAIIRTQGDHQNDTLEEQEELIRRQEEELRRQQREIDELRGRRQYNRYQPFDAPNRQCDDPGDDFAQP